MDDADNDIIRHELPRVNKGFCLQAHLRALFEGFPDDVARGDRGDGIVGGEHLSLRSLTRARRAKKNEFHAFLLSRFLVKEALIVAHHHLGFQLLHRFKRNTDQNDDRRAAQ